MAPKTESSSLGGDELPISGVIQADVERLSTTVLQGIPEFIRPDVSELIQGGRQANTDYVLTWSHGQKASQGQLEKAQSFLLAQTDREASMSSGRQVWPAGAWRKQQRQLSLELSPSQHLCSHLPGPEGVHVTPGWASPCPTSPTSNPVSLPPAPARKICSSRLPSQSFASRKRFLFPDPAGMLWTAPDRFSSRLGWTCSQPLFSPSPVRDLEQNTSPPEPGSLVTKMGYNFYLGIIDKGRCLYYVKLKRQICSHVC